MSNEGGSMIKRYLEILNEQSRNVFGVKPKKVLSAYSLFTIASIILPLTALALLLIFRLF